jgi:hypothetical protein
MSFSRYFGLDDFLEGLRPAGGGGHQSATLSPALSAPNGREKPPPPLRRIALLVLAAFCMTSVAVSQVSVSAPFAGQTVGSPMHVVASATSTHPITAMRIYLDSVSVYLGSAAQIDTTVTAGTGSHLLVVQAWDSTGAVFKAPLTITVGTAPSPTPTPLPANAIVYNEVQQMTGWQTCGACGNPGGTGTPPTYSMVRGITFPTLSGSSTQFNIGGGTRYANAYWFIAHPAMNTGINSLRYEFDIYIPAGLENAPQAIEFECQQRLSGFLYNFAWQAAYADGNQWRVFNYNTKKWENTGIPVVRFSPNAWHHVVAEFHNNSATHMTYHDALTIDGLRHPILIGHAATPVSAGNEFTNGFQLDLNVVPTAFHVFVDNMKVTIVN